MTSTTPPPQRLFFCRRANDPAPSISHGEFSPSAFSPIVTPLWRTPGGAPHQIATVGADLSTPLPQLPEPGTLAEVILAEPSNELSTRELRRFLHRACWLLEAGGTLSFVTRDPDEFPDSLWPGSRHCFKHITEDCVTEDRVTEDYVTGDDVTGDDVTEVYRPLRHILELLRLFPCRESTPQSFTLPRHGRFLLWRASRDRRDSRDIAPQLSPQDKYGVQSPYQRFDRLEEPEIVDDLLYGASRLRLQPGERLLSLGVNQGRELQIFDDLDINDTLEIWGVDHSPSAIAAARKSFAAPQHHFICADLSQLANLDLPLFQGVLLLNVLQCTTVDRTQVLRDLKRLLAKRCRALISIPNCHFGEHDILRRPLRRDHPRHDRSLVHKDLRYLTRELFRAGFRTVESFGTYDAFLLASR